ncbi:MBOAT family O-acyltransferase [Marinomonas sp. PE14-40]|uniref:MBOAT family O-acyltransferase n=1 Tax=Marinomonas sp. PE14-40 TaxID=3060621 RepID=UPI003F67783A
MLFNSYEFILFFLPSTFLIYFYFNKKGFHFCSKIFLIFASLFFYSWWNVLYLPIIIASIVINFFTGRLLCKKKYSRVNKKRVLILGVSFNILLLSYFKYMDFFIYNINVLAEADIEVLNIVLPLAISFFTFQQIAYLVDSYRNKVKNHKFYEYFLFVVFFPQLIAGPIVHHSEMLEQFGNVKNRIINYRNVFLGLIVFSVGLFKKVVVADSFSVWANLGFDSNEPLSLIEAWSTSLSYTFQLYFDFSGYCDMAIGCALLFNIKLPINFNSPYKAISIQEFWRRWHITLSSFLREYVYIPLGGNRGSRNRTYINLIITFLIGGLWHGAGWNFIVWGGLHGIALSINKMWSYSGVKIWKWLSWIITFNFVNAAWVFFRADSIDDALKILSAMIGLTSIVNESSGSYELNFEVLLSIVFSFSFVLLFSNINRKAYVLKDNKIPIPFFNSFLYGVLFFYSFLMLLLTDYTEFIYFNF